MIPKFKGYFYYCSHYGNWWNISRLALPLISAQTYPECTSSVVIPKPDNLLCSVPKDLYLPRLHHFKLLAAIGESHDARRNGHSSSLLTRNFTQNDVHLIIRNLFIPSEMIKGSWLGQRERRQKGYKYILVLNETEATLILVNSVAEHLTSESEDVSRWKSGKRKEEPTAINLF